MPSSLTPTRLRAIKNILNVISGVLITLAVLSTIVYHVTLFGMQVRNIATTSMVPAISKNDAVLVATRNVGAVAPGEIVAYKADWLNDNMVVHRVTKVDGDTITVKGDANSTSDPAFDKSRIVGKVDTVIPHVGWFFTIPGYLTMYGLGVLSALASYLLGRKLPQRRTVTAAPVANTASPRRLFRSSTTAADEGEIVLPRRAAADEVVEGVVLPSSDEEGFIDQHDPAFVAPKRAATEEPEGVAYVPAHGYDPDEVEESYVPAHAAENDEFDFVDADLGGLDTSFIPVVKNEQPVVEEEVVEAVPSVDEVDEVSEETVVRMGGFHLYRPELKEPVAVEEPAEPVTDIAEPIAEELAAVYTPRRGFIPDDEEGEEVGSFVPAHVETEPETAQVDEVTEVDESLQTLNTEAVEQTHTDLPVIEEEFTKVTTETEPTPEEKVYTEAEFEKAVETANEVRTPDLAETSAEFVEGATIKSDGLVELDTSNYTPNPHQVASEATEPSNTVSEAKSVEPKHVFSDGINDDEFINSDDEDELDSLPDLS